MIIGSPAKAVRQLTPEQIEGLRQSARTTSQRPPLSGGSAQDRLITAPREPNGARCAARLPTRFPRVSELHKFLFDGLPVRGMLVRLTEAWQEVLRRRAGNTATGAYPPPVRELLGEMAAAGVLMQANIKFNGALVLQIFGDGPVKLAVAEVQPT
jgi:hypothetical protein